MFFCPLQNASGFLCFHPRSVSGIAGSTFVRPNSVGFEKPEVAIKPGNFVEVHVQLVTQIFCIGWKNVICSALRVNGEYNIN
jgi:hypothetical protein